MEKDYFKDRPKEVTDIDYIKPGVHVLICTKEAQKYARELSDLTYGIVIRVLTRNNHPRGIKVEIICPNGETAIGRCTYITQNGKVLTKTGFKSKEETNKY